MSDPVWTADWQAALRTAPYGSARIVANAVYRHLALSRRPLDVIDGLAAVARQRELTDIERAVLAAAASRLTAELAGVGVMLS